ncbi:MAG: phosphoribosylanthranilate isomerase [Armatimonadetes bacterium]|nr:phosphoribosylanthranilate isomerase [Armatimonadota bacterium]
MTRIKICGITNKEDAEAAVEAGADAIGLNFFAESPRHVTPERAAEIIAVVSPFVTSVGVFVDTSVNEVRETLRVSGCTVAQLHGAEDQDYLGALAPIPVIKVVRVGNSLETSLFEHYREARAILLDTYVAGQMGGTGQRFDPTLASGLIAEGWRIIMAGGLTPKNVGEVVAKVRPHGVDVSSGVEIKPGRKDHMKIRQFVAAVRAAEEGS